MDEADEAVFDQFVNSSWHRLLRTAYLLVGDHGHAEDLVQITLVRMHRRWVRIDRPEVYVRQVLVNLAASHWRKVLRVREHPSEHVPDSAVRDEIAQRDTRDELWRALHALPSKMRAVLVLRYFEDLSEADTAKALGCSVGSVKSQASRGLARLRERLHDARMVEDAWQAEELPAMHRRRQVGGRQRLDGAGALDRPCALEGVQA